MAGFPVFSDEVLGGAFVRAALLAVMAIVGFGIAGLDRARAQEPGHMQAARGFPLRSTTDLLADVVTAIGVRN